VFETIHGATNAQEFATRLRNAATTYYGTAGPAFIERLLKENLKLIVAAIEQYHKEFKQKFCPANSAAQVGRVVRRFSLIAAAGELAIKFGILPWAAGEAERGISECFKAWLNERGSVDESTDQIKALRQLQRELDRRAEDGFTWINATGVEDNHVVKDHTPTRDRLGYKRKSDEGILKFLIPPDKLKDLCAPYDYKMVKQMLIRKGVMRTRKEKDKKTGKERERDTFLIRPSDTGVQRQFHVISSKIFDPGLDLDQEECEASAMDEPPF
jgi:putative DNA primase/helicase